MFGGHEPHQTCSPTDNSNLASSWKTTFPERLTKDQSKAIKEEANRAISLVKPKKILKPK